MPHNPARGERCPLGVCVPGRARPLYPALEPDDKGVMGVLGIARRRRDRGLSPSPGDLEVLRMRLVWEGVLWPDGGGVWDGEAVMDLYDDRETVGGGLAWSRLGQSGW